MPKKTTPKKLSPGAQKAKELAKVLKLKKLADKITADAKVLRKENAAARKKVAKYIKPKAAKKGKRGYKWHKPPVKLHPKGLHAIKAKAKKAGTLAKKCLIDGTKLHNKPIGRKRLICAKPVCFRAMRNAYRIDILAEKKAA